MKRILFLILLGVTLITCTHRWIAVPQNIRSFELCESLNNGPQMLKVSQFKSAVIIVHDCSVMDEERVSIAMHIFLKKWKEQFPHNVVGNERVEDALNSLSTEFSGVKKTANGYTIDGAYHEGLRVSGLTLAPGWIWVKIRPGGRLCQTSFIHELVHVAIWASKGTDGDPDHLGDKYSGWKMEHNLLIQDTNKILCDWGI
jgi:hypothetical protein